jgi:large subunit ribosomal protein L10
MEVFMPTPRKVALTEDTRDRIERTLIAIGTDYRGLNVAEMTAFRRAMRAANVEVKVVKNTLTKMAAEQAGRPEMIEIVTGPTALILGYEDPIAPAKALVEYIRQQRLDMEIYGAWLDGEVLDRAEVESLASLPSREQLIANVVGKLQGPLYSLSGLLQSTTRNFVGLIEARANQLDEDAAA